jgi:uncharacterized protein YegL
MLRSVAPYMVLLAFAASFAYSQEIEIENEEGGFELSLDRREDFEINLHELNERAFSYDFHIQIPDYSGSSLDEVEIYSRDGRLVYDRVGFENEGFEYVIGSLEEGHNIHISATDPHITFSLIDEHQNRLNQVEDDDLAIFVNGRQECYRYQHSSVVNVTSSVGIAIDISGSMSGYENEINQSVQSFLDALDDSAFCTIVEFNHDYRILHGGEGQKQICKNIRNFSISGISGGTTAFPALEKTYELVQEQSSQLELVLVVSDGISDEDRLDKALRQKGDTTTYVNWLGYYNEHYPLARFADAEIFGAVQQDGTLEKFFGVAGQSISGQFAATPCGN